MRRGDNTAWGVEDFSPEALRNISFMQRMSKTLPEDYFMIAAMQEIAVLLTQITPLLTKEQEATLLGIGALLIRDGRDEMIAGIQAAIAIQSARRAA